MELEIYKPKVVPTDHGNHDDEDELTIYPEYYHPLRNDQFYDKYIVKGKHGGYFIDIGAGNGETNSGSYFFEKYREWHGLVVEPSKHYESTLRATRAKPVCAAVSNVTSSISNGSSPASSSAARSGRSWRSRSR